MKKPNRENGKGAKAAGMEFDAAVLHAFERQRRRKKLIRADILGAFKKVRVKK
jgi:hypothetical protein